MRKRNDDLFLYFSGCRPACALLSQTCMQTTTVLAALAVVATKVMHADVVLFHYQMRKKKPGFFYINKIVLCLSSGFHSSLTHIYFSFF